MANYTRKSCGLEENFIFVPTQIARGKSHYPWTLVRIIYLRFIVLLNYNIVCSINIRHHDVVITYRKDMGWWLGHCQLIKNWNDIAYTQTVLTQWDLKTTKIFCHLSFHHSVLLEVRQVYFLKLKLKFDDKSTIFITNFKFTWKEKCLNLC